LRLFEPLYDCLPQNWFGFGWNGIGLLMQGPSPILDYECIRNTVVLRFVVADTLTSQQRALELAQKLHQKAQKKILLQLKHVGIEATLVVPVTFDVQIQNPVLIWMKSLRLQNQVEEFLCSQREIFASLYAVIERDGIAVLLNRLVKSIVHEVWR
jgi:hypothetical protein